MSLATVGLWMLVLEWLDHFDHTLDCLSMSPSLVPCTARAQLLKSCPFGGYACAIWRAGQKVNGRACVAGGRVLPGLSALW